MTDDRAISDLALRALAAFIAEVHPSWDAPGVLTALRAESDSDPWQLAQRMIHRAADPANTTPRLQPFDAAVLVGCRQHPWSSTRTDGTCGACFSERNAGDGLITPRAGYGDAPAKARELFHASREAK